MFWSAIPSSPSSYSVAVGDKLSFRYSNYHNLYLMASKAAYESCDFSGGVELGSTTRGGGSESTPNLYEAVVSAAGTYYLACQVGSHCSQGQKITVTVAAASWPASRPPPAAPPPPAATSGSPDAALVVGLVVGGVALLALLVGGVLVF